MALPHEVVALPISNLRSEVSGRVITSQDDGFDQARTILYGGFDRRPAVIVRAASPRDVQRVVRLARETGLDLAVRCGGHSVAGHSATDGGILLDLGGMKGLEVDAGARTAWAEGGLTAGETTMALADHGLAVGFGDTGSVGIGGITLGGGVGYLTRKHGMTIDSLLGADIVTADGEMLRVGPDAYPDLFWAIRGGGGNFGVVTRFLFRLQPVDRVYGGLLILPATPEVVEGFVAAAHAAPDGLSTIANVMPAPPLPFLPAESVGRLIVLASMVYAGDPNDGPAAVAPLRGLATPLADMLRPMAYPEIYPPDAEGYHPLVAQRTLFVDSVGAEEASAVVGRLQASDAPVRVAQLRVLGGAMARVPVEATAFAHRERRIMATIAAFHDGTPDGFAARRQWVEAFAGDLHPAPGAYVNFMQDRDDEAVHMAYPGETWSRLAAVKQSYDPDNVFHLNHNIAPEGR